MREFTRKAVRFVEAGGLKIKPQLAADAPFPANPAPY